MYIAENIDFQEKKGTLCDLQRFLDECARENFLNLRTLGRT